MLTKFSGLAAVAALALASSPSAAKTVWTCQYAKDQVLLTATMQPDPAPPGQTQAASALALKGNVELVLSQRFLAPGKPSSSSNGEYSFKGYIKDNGAVLVFSPDRQIASSEWLIDRRDQSGRFAGMFMSRPVSDGIGRPLNADFDDLTGAAPPEYLHFRFMLPPTFYETTKYWARIPMAEFKALHARAVTKAQSTASTTLAKC
jgi:hypothetical protein